MTASDRRIDVDEWMGFAATAGVTPDRFWKMTPREVHAAIEGYRLRRRDDMRIAAMHGAWVLNAIAGAVGSRQVVRGSELVRFDDEAPRRTAFTPRSHREAMLFIKMEEEAEEFWGSRDGAPREILPWDSPEDD